MMPLFPALLLRHRMSLMPLILAVLLAPSSHAARAWAWVNGDPPVLNSTYNFNSAGGTMTVTSSATGIYEVKFAGVYATLGGNVQVSAYNGSQHCSVVGWNREGANTVVIDVRCYNTLGNLVNGAFTILFYSEPTGAGTRNSAYFWMSASVASNASPVPDPTWSWNSKGNANTIRRTGVGTYVAVLGGLTPAQSHAHVTPYGANSGICSVQGMQVVSGDLEVGVNCYNAAGSAADSSFTFSLMSDVTVGGDPLAPTATGYALAEQPTATSYIPVNHNLRTAGTLQASRNGTGSYRMFFNNIFPTPPTKTFALVTAYAAAPGVYCNITSWDAQPTGISIGTQCRTAQNVATDAQYEVLFISNVPTGPVPPMSITGVTTGSEFGGGFNNFASNSYIEIKGTGLADTTRSWTGDDFTNGGQNAPTVLDGVRVTINGLPAFPYYVSPTQLNVHTPSDVATGNSTINVTVGIRSASTTSQKLAVTPGILAPTSFKVEGRQYAAATFPDGFFVGKVGLITGVAFRPARPGDTITFYGIGFGDVIQPVTAGRVVTAINDLSRPLTVSFGTIPATVTYKGLAPGLVGLYQFNVVVPASVTTGDYQINMSLGGTPLPQPAFFLTVQGN